MVNVVRFRLRADPEEEAAAWIARIDKGLSSEQQAELEKWLAADVRHRRAFRTVAAWWDDAGSLAELAEVLPLNRSLPRRARSLGKYAIAAVVLAAVSAGMFLAQRQGFLWNSHATAFTASFETPIGGRLTDELPDRSVVVLNTDTEVVVEYSRARRTLFLQRGEAHFEVAPDLDRPFEVHAAGGVVSAVGTAFNVRVGAAGRLEVTVTEGKVTLAPAAELARAAVPVPVTNVAAGELAVLDPAYGEPEPRVLPLEAIDLDTKLAWQRGMLIFRGEPLEDILREVSRYTTVRFELADPELAQLRVGGYFRAGDVESLLAALRESLRIESERLDGDRIALHAAD